MLLIAAVLAADAQPGSPPDTPSPSIRNLGALNTPSDDYAPYVTPDHMWLYYSSSRGGSADVYRARREGDGWRMPELLGAAGVNTSNDDGSYYSPVPALAEVIPLDAAAMKRLNAARFGLFTSGDRDDGAGSADLYIADVSQGGLQFENVRLLDALSTEEWDAQATAAPDGSFIIFSSNRPGGAGEMDLYIARRGDSGFTAPVNLGAAVNTEGNEFSPFVASDGRTLFFASTGHGGFGGADLFRSVLREDGTWSAAQNLGGAINTSDNELFFYGVGREQCFFTSDRPGGKGGLDLYEMRPNIFATGYTDMKMTIMDTVAGRPVPGTVRVKEGTLGTIVTEMRIPVEGIDISLFASLPYTLEFDPDGFPPVTVTPDDLQPGGRTTLTVNVGSIPPKPEFILNAADLDLRWFVSGYYRINTPALLEDLRARQRSGDLRRLGYIANVAGADSLYSVYSGQSEQVQRILNDFYRRAVEQYFPAYYKGKNPDEYLEITVYGYADPRPITGTYIEKPVTFFGMDGREVTVSTGESLTNFKLAGLRAHYAVEYFDRLFREAAADGHPEYATLVDRGMIRWRPVSGDVDTSGSEDLSQLRRVRIDFRRVGRDGAELQ